MSTTFLDAALEYAAAGIPIFVCHPGSKKPATANGHKDRTCDLGQIRAWFDEHPHANIATVPADNGWCVIDKDPGGQIDLPATYIVRTPRGEHHYFQGSLPPTTGGLGPHVDTRGNDSYVLLPPSRTPDGEYVELTPGAVPAVLPDWVPRALAERKARQQVLTAPSDRPLDEPAAVSRFEAWLARQPALVEGQNSDHHTFAYACQARDMGLSDGLALEYLADFAPDFDREWIEAKVANAYRYGQNAPGAKVLDPPSEVFAGVLEKLADKLAPAAKRSDFYFEDEAEQENTTEPTWIIPDVIPDEVTVLLVAQTGSFKTFIALDIALSLACGAPVLGAKPVRTGPAFYAAAEGRADLKTRRRRAWKIARGITGEIEFYVSRTPLVADPDTLEEFKQALRDRLAGRRPSIIVLDTLNKVFGLSENDARDVGQLLRFCDELKDEFRCSVLVLHHPGHASDRARGSTALEAGFDTILELSRTPQQSVASLRVKQHKDADARGKPWRLQASPVAGSLALSVISEDAYNEASAGGELTPGRVKAALSAMGAVSRTSAVTSQVLATELNPKSEDDSAEQHNQAVAECAKRLNHAAPKLAGLWARHGKDGYLWFTGPPQ